ncbi:MAG: stage II sporulation protein P [Candidatus Avoscillospira sp.]
MYERKSRRCCAAMLAVSVCLRLCMFLGLDAKAAAWISTAARSTDFARWMVFLETGQVTQAEEPAQEQSLYVLRMEPAAASPEEKPVQEIEAQVTSSEAVSAPLPANLASAEQIAMEGGCTYTVDKAALLARPSALDFTGDGPKILILHTHATEAYTQEPGWEYEASSEYRTLDTDRSVVQVGRVLAETLEAHGIEVIHDEALNDYPSYNGSYAAALERIQQWLDQYPGIQMVIDVHRDAVADESGQAVALSATENGESCARLMLVVGTDQGGLSHPNWQENLANALKLQSVLAGAYPGLCRSLDLRTERFNQHMTPGSLLVEVGSNGNTLQQAMRSARLLGDGLASMIAALEANGGLLEAAP